MAKDATNGRPPGSRRGQNRLSRSSLTKEFQAERLAELVSDDENNSIEQAFQKGDIDTIRRFAAMYAKRAVVFALEKIGVNILWEIQQYVEISRDAESSPAVRMEALSKIQSIRATVFDSRIGPTAKRPVGAATKEAREAREVDPSMRQEAETADQAWDPPKGEGG